MARERYLLHTGDEEIHNQEKEIKLVTKKDKWSNFWYYHKKHVIIGIVLVALLGMFIYDMASKINPDYTISLVVGDGYMTEQDTLELEQELARYGEDLNGDGQTVVSVVAYNLMLGENSKDLDPEMQVANIYKLAGALFLLPIHWVSNIASRMKGQRSWGIWMAQRPKEKRIWKR